MKNVFPKTDVNLKSASLKYFLIISLLFKYLEGVALFLVSHASRYFRYTHLHVHVQMRETHPSLHEHIYTHTHTKEELLINFLVHCSRGYKE